jgi:hypothetical protein
MALLKKSNTNPNPPQHLAQAAWRLVKEFAGIYNNHYEYHMFPQYELSVLLYETSLFMQNYTHYGIAIRTLQEGVRPTYLFHQDPESPGVLKPVERHYITEMSYAYFTLKHPEYVSGTDPKRVPYHWNGRKVCGVNTAIDLTQFDDIAHSEWIDWNGTWWSPSQINNGSSRQKLPPIGFKCYNTEPELWKFLEECIEQHAIENSARAIPVAKANFFKAVARHPSRNAIYEELHRVHKGRRRRCMCGTLVPTNRKSVLDRHLKTTTHCKNVTYKSNLRTIAKWHHITGYTPVAFERRSTLPFPTIDTWSHVIPADSKRTNRHWCTKALLKPSEAVELTFLMRRATDGHGMMEVNH